MITIYVFISIFKYLYTMINLDTYHIHNHYTPVTSIARKPATTTFNFDSIADVNKIPINCLHCGKVITLVLSVKNYENKHKCPRCGLIHKFNHGRLTLSEDKFHTNYTLFDTNNTALHNNVSLLCQNYINYLYELEKGTCDENILKADSFISSVNLYRSLVFTSTEKPIHNAFRTAKINFIDFDTRSKCLILDHLRREESLKRTIPEYDNITTEMRQYLTKKD